MQRIDLGPANRHAALCITRIRFLSLWIKDILRKEGLWDDLIQEMYATAFEAWKKDMDTDDTRRFAQRRIYAFLTAYGFRLYRRGYVRREMPFCAAFDESIFDKGLAPRDGTPLPSPFIGGNHHNLDEEVLAFLKTHPEGQPRQNVCSRFQVHVRELDRHLAPLIEQRQIVEVKRENIRGRPLTPLLVVPEPGQPLPAPRMVRTERNERIRQAYFQQGKGIKRIAREFNHSRKTVRQALAETQATA